MRSFSIGNSQQVIVYGVGCGIDGHGLIQLGNGFTELAAPDLHQAESTVGHAQGLVLEGGERIVGDVSRLG